MDDSVSSRLNDAITKFNQYDYFECHEILEDIWFDTHDESKDFYQGLLHIAVGLHHLTNKNNINGMKLQFGKAFSRLERYLPEYNGVELAALLKQIDTINKNPVNYELTGLPKIKLL